MPLVSLKRLQRGPTLKVIISILRVGGTQDNAEKTSETILVDDTVEVRFKFKFTGGVTPHVSLKLKEANEEQPMVQIQLIAREQLNGREIMNKHLFCTTERVELKMSTVGYYTSEDVNGVAAWSYLLDVDITVYTHFYAATLPNIENVYQDTEFTDFQLSAADGKVAVHKVFLAANSTVFKAMISGEWKEKAEGCINIDGVTMKTLQHLKDYMYQGVLPDEGLESLLVVACQYLMDKLKADCIQKLVQSLKVENLDVLIKLATRHDIPELVKALIYKTPDSVVTDLHKLEIKGEESTDVDTN